MVEFAERVYLESFYVYFPVAIRWVRFFVISMPSLDELEEFFGETTLLRIRSNFKGRCVLCKVYLKATRATSSLCQIFLLMSDICPFI